MTLAHICQHVVNTISICLYRGHWLPTDSWQRILENLQGHYLQENHPRYGSKENATFQQLLKNLIFQINIQEQLETSEVLLLIFHYKNIPFVGHINSRDSPFKDNVAIWRILQCNYVGQDRFSRIDPIQDPNFARQGAMVGSGHERNYLFRIWISNTSRKG